MVEPRALDLARDRVAELEPAEVCDHVPLVAGDITDPILGLDEHTHWSLTSTTQDV